MRLLALAFCIFGPATAFAWADGCEFRAERDTGLDTTGAEKIVIRAGAGDLKVTGHAGATRIEAHGIACARKQDLLAVSMVRVHRDGNVIYVETVLPQDDRSLLQNLNDSAYIDLDISVPAGITIEATDSSGDATFEDLKSLEIRDSSGDLTLRRIAGAIDVTDSSGDLEIENAGSVRARDSSGDIDIRNVAGNVMVEQDSSGGIHVAHVGGDFTVGQDGSGDIEYEAVRGKVEVPKHGRD